MNSFILLVQFLSRMCQCVNRNEFVKQELNLHTKLVERTVLFPKDLVKGKPKE